MNNTRQQQHRVSLLSGDDRIDRGTLWVLLVGIFLVSFSRLTFEIGLTRLLSLKFAYHYAFIIMLSLPVTKTGRSLEGYSLTENYLFTEDSIQDYMDHLTDEGRLMVVAHNLQEILRLLSITLATLGENGIDNKTAMEQIYIVGSDQFPVFVLGKTAFEPVEMVAAHEAIHRLGYDPTMSYLPAIGQANYVSHVAAVDYKPRRRRNYQRQVSRGGPGCPSRRTPSTSGECLWIFR